MLEKHGVQTANRRFDELAEFFRVPRVGVPCYVVAFNENHGVLQDESVWFSVMKGCIKGERKEELGLQRERREEVVTYTIVPFSKASYKGFGDFLDGLLSEEVYYPSNSSDGNVFSYY